MKRIGFFLAACALASLAQAEQRVVILDGAGTIGSRPDTKELDKLLAAGWRIVIANVSAAQSRNVFVFVLESPK